MRLIVKIIWWVILCIRYSTLFWIIIRNHGEKTDKPSIRIYVNKIENRIKFKTKPRYYLELWTPETMKLFGSTKGKITKDKNGEDVPHLKTTEITEILLIHCNIVNNDYEQVSRALPTFFFW